MTETAQAIPTSANAEVPSALAPSALVASGLTPSAAPPYRFLVAWAACWTAIGAVVGFGIAFTRGVPELLPLLRQSVLFAEVVGFTALASARLVFPYFARLPIAVRLAL